MPEPPVALSDVLAAARRRLTAAGVPTPGVDAVLLWRHVSGWSHGHVLLRRDGPADPVLVERFTPLVERRAGREPLQLIVGTVGFRHLEIEVRPGVFIPRPETEILAGEAIARTPPGGTVLEPCTGTGAVACAVAHESEAGLVLAADQSVLAVDLARRNAARCGVDVQVAHGDLLEPFPSRLKAAVDVIVANPPYVARSELAGLEPEVIDWDPLDALVSGATGHEITDRLIAAAVEWLRPGGWLLLEVAAIRAEATAERCRRGGWSSATTVDDLAGQPRVVAARR